MLLRSLLSLPLIICALSATPITYSITANSYYPSSYNEVQADAYVKQMFPFELPDSTTLTFSATYSQTPHTCNNSDCNQDLNTFAYTQFGLYFDSTPDKGICDKATGAPFPCSATLPAGEYDLVLEINDVLSTPANTAFVVYPFSDTLTVTVDGLSTPEPASIWTALLGLAIVLVFRNCHKPATVGRALSLVNRIYKRCHGTHFATRARQESPNIYGV